MDNQTNILNLKSNKNSLKGKSIYSHSQVDSMIKKEGKLFKENTKIEVDCQRIEERKKDKIQEVKISEVSTKKTDNSSVDDNKRMFLKVAGVAGLGLAASALIPKSANAYVTGSTPTSNVVGLKNIANTKIDPATESKQDAILTELQLKADLTETQPVSVAGTVNVAIPGGAVVSGVVGINDSVGTRINPAQDDSVILLRRIVKLMESQAVVDNQMRQRVVIDAGSLTTAGTISTVSAVSSLNQLAGVDSRWQIIDWSRQVYNSGVRNNLSW